MPSGEGPTSTVKAAPIGIGETTFWIQGTDAWGKLDDDSNAAKVNRKLIGFFGGIDRRFSPNVLAGFASGYTNSASSISSRSSTSNIDSAHLAAYVEVSEGAWTLRTAAAASFSGLETSRSIVFPGFGDIATSSNGAATAQLFSEVGYSIAFDQIAVEPFGSLALIHLSTDSFTETMGNSFGAAALKGSSSTNDIGYSTFGGRAATNFILPDETMLTLRVSSAWEHYFGSASPTSTLKFQSTGTKFTISGIPLTRDAALFESGLDLHVTPQTKLGLSYATKIGKNVQDNSVKGNFVWQF